MMSLLDRYTSQYDLAPRGATDGRLRGRANHNDNSGHPKAQLQHTILSLDEFGSLLVPNEPDRQTLNFRHYLRSHIESCGVVMTKPSFELGNTGVRSMDSNILTSKSLHTSLFDGSVSMSEFHTLPILFLWRLERV